MSAACEAAACCSALPARVLGAGGNNGVCALAACRSCTFPNKECVVGAAKPCCQTEGSKPRNCLDTVMGPICTE